MKTGKKRSFYKGLPLYSYNEKYVMQRNKHILHLGKLKNECTIPITRNNFIRIINFISSCLIYGCRIKYCLKFTPPL